MKHDSTSRRKLVKFLRQNHLHAAGLARQIGASRSLVSLLLLGACRPGLGTALNIEKATCGVVAAAGWMPYPRPCGSKSKA